MFTTDDVGKRVVNGVEVEISLAEKQAIVDEWNANINNEIIPQSVTRRQAKQALITDGLIQNVQPAIDAIADPTQRALMQVEWDDSQVFLRDRPQLIMLANALGLSSEQLDALFIKASQL